MTIKLNNFQAGKVIKKLAQFFEIEVFSDCLEKKITINKNSTISSFDFSNGIGLLLFDINNKEAIHIQFDYQKPPPLFFTYTAAGEITNTNNKEEVVVEKGHQLILLNHQDYLDNWVISPNFKGAIIILDRIKYNEKLDCYVEQLPSNIKALFKDIDGQKYFQHKALISVLVEESYEHIISDKTKDIVRSNYIEGNTLEMLSYMINRFRNRKENIHGFHSEKFHLSLEDVANIKNVRTFIYDHFTERLHIKDLAQKAKMNTTKFKKAYLYIYEETTRQSIIRLRLSKARTLLLENNKSIKEIAQAVGYSNASYFSKRFMKKFKVYPKDYISEVTGKFVVLD